MCSYKPMIPVPVAPKRAIIPEAATFDYAHRPQSKIDDVCSSSERLNVPSAYL
jgi:hypothetical protein